MKCKLNKKALNLPDLYYLVFTHGEKDIKYIQ